MSLKIFNYKVPISNIKNPDLLKDWDFFNGLN